MTFIYLVRRGETDWNLARKIQGSTDIPLNDTGREQAVAAGRLLARREWDGIYASPLSRAFETASIIAAQLGMPDPSVVNEMVERNYGDAEGLTGGELSERFPDDYPVPGRESREDVAARVIPALVRLAESRPGDSLIVVSHGGVIRTVLNEVGPEDSPHHTSMITNGSVHSFHYVDEGLVLIAFDDPMETESITPGSEDIEEQNAIERRGD